ncbi:hypothetical protein D3C87_2050710 [compost metagenome]
MHPRMRSGDLVYERLATPGDDDAVAELMECCGESPTDAARAAGDENCVASQMHV